MRNDTPSPTLAYIESLYGPNEDWLNELHDSLTDDRRYIQLGKAEVRLLQILVALHKPKLIIEIGTLVGYSALAMAQFLPSEGKIITFESNPEHALLAKNHFNQYPGGGMITLIEGDAHHNLAQYAPQQPIDMIFIDADKGGYADYLAWAIENLRPGGLLIADNTLLFGAVLEIEKPDNISLKSFEAMKKFNQTIADNKLFTGILIPTTEGLTVAIKK